MIVATITGLALSALLPTVRSAPGLSRTPWRALTPAPIAFAVLDPATAGDPSDPGSMTAPGRIEGETGDLGAILKESADPEWIAARPTTGRGMIRPSTRRISPIDRREPEAHRSPLGSSTVASPTPPGLPVRLCRLLF